MRKNFFGLIIGFFILILSSNVFAYEPPGRQGMFHHPFWGVSGCGTTDCFLMGRTECAHFYLQLSQDLELTNDQLEKLRKIDKECRTSVIRHEAEAEVARIEMNSLLDTRTPDISDVEKKIEEIDKHETEMKKACLSASLQARAVLTEEQYGKSRTFENPMCKMKMTQMEKRERISPRAGIDMGEKEEED